MVGRALLIGASRYGEGFIDLPAAEHDVRLMQRTLESRGFVVDVVGPEIVCNASLLEGAMSAFCQSVRDGVGLIYFSGHGLAIDDQEWILPAGVSRAAATRSATQRVSTDLSASVTNHDALIVFVIDACREAQDDSTAKGSRSWTRGKQEYGDKNFIRIFGCAEKELCHVWRKGRDGHDISVFTAALSQALGPSSKSETLEELLALTGEECEKIATAANPRLPRQKPSIGSLGDINAGTLAQLTRQRIFQRIATPTRASSADVWSAFDPQRLHCLILESEHANIDDPSAPSAEPLRASVHDVFLRAGQDIWESFRRFWMNRRLVDGSLRQVPEFHASRISRTVLSVVDAFKTRDGLESAIRAAVQADVAFFDVTRFEPGVMFLLGVRAATRRGVTICSHGYGRRRGQKLETPFNLNDLQVFSHGDTDGGTDDPAVRRLIEATREGFRQLDLQPRYLDLPAYDALRELGSESEAWGTIPFDTLVLALCSFRPEHRHNWNHLRRELESALQRRGANEPRVRRLIDLGSPQLVSQALYEHIRRVAACVMDWSLHSPSSFMEVGVRLAVSPWGALQVIDERCLPDAPRAAKIVYADGRQGSDLQQVALMQEHLQPRIYRIGSTEIFDELAEILVTRRPFEVKDRDFNWVHQVVREAVERVSVSQPAVYDALNASAEALNSSKKDRSESTQDLFAMSKSVKRDQERAALERRIAAWLYLEHRVKPAGLSEKEVSLYNELGTQTAAALYESDAPEDSALAEEIRRRSVAEWHLHAKLHRKRGESLRRANAEDRALAEFRAGVAAIQRIIDRCRHEPGWSQARSDTPSQGQIEIARELVEAYGARGGLQRRLNDPTAALESYREGASLEKQFVPQSSYNQVNAVKLALLSGAHALNDLDEEIRRLEALLTGQLAEDQTRSDNAWAWADLGDCRALLGDVAGAEAAYRTFVEKARTNAPNTTLDVLRDIYEKLVQMGDPKAASVSASLQALEAKLA